MQSTSVEKHTEPKKSTQSSTPILHLEKTFPNQNISNNLVNKKEKLVKELITYKAEKAQELTRAKQLNRWSIGIALVLTAATTICGSSQEEKIQGLVAPLGTLAVTINGWIASVPMSKKVSLYERVLVKADNLRSDLEFEVEAEDDLEEIRENFKSLKVELIQENPNEQPKLQSARSGLKS
ncbi:hypothetical protein [Lyngbya sp. PCC 8106]|uniref:hypothetical protein n=1 Tax=Lyngbya sp. (strain PCC 8106) TaxID=313612 RepID=UPI0000EA9EE5|nr:hypothetical protein [Lyngbya sp. PCC 8106]EAW36688.1 hypothetical protein L8106_29590 [Lyngbya sp. PCC 8106]